MIYKYKSIKLNSSKFTNNSIKHQAYWSKSNGFNYCYVSLTIQLNIKHISQSYGFKYCDVSLTIQLNIKHISQS